VNVKLKVGKVLHAHGNHTGTYPFLQGVHVLLHHEPPPLPLRCGELLEGAKHATARACVVSALSYVSVGITTTIRQAVGAECAPTSVAREGKAPFKVEESSVTPRALQRQKSIHNVSAGVLDLKIVCRHASQLLALRREPRFVLHFHLLHKLLFSQLVARAEEHSKHGRRHVCRKRLIRIPMLGVLIDVMRTCVTVSRLWGFAKKARRESHGSDGNCANLIDARIR
jgi:hypothetical protein